MQKMTIENPFLILIIKFFIQIGKLLQYIFKKLIIFFKLWKSQPVVMFSIMFTISIIITILIFIFILSIDKETGFSSFSNIKPNIIQIITKEDSPKINNDSNDSNNSDSDSNSEFAELDLLAEESFDKSIDNIIIDPNQISRNIWDKRFELLNANKERIFNIEINEKGFWPRYLPINSLEEVKEFSNKLTEINHDKMTYYYLLNIYGCQKAIIDLKLEKLISMTKINICDFLNALVLQESKWNMKNATSPVNAGGPYQFMPLTYERFCKGNRSERYVPEKAMICGPKYFLTLVKECIHISSDDQKQFIAQDGIPLHTLQCALSAYNAGSGYINSKDKSKGKRRNQFMSGAYSCFRSFRETNNYCDQIIDNTSTGQMFSDVETRRLLIGAKY